MTEKITFDEAKARAARWRWAGIAGALFAIAATVFTGFAFQRAAYYERLAEEIQTGFVARVEYSRPCHPGQRDVTASARNVTGLADVDPYKDPTVCGLLAYEEKHNALTNEGANDVWVVYLASSGRTAGGTWYVGLTSATPSATSTLSTITEISGGGYSRKAITWDFGTSRHAKTGNVTFTATGAWSTGATYMFITNAASGTSGKMLNYLALSAVRQPAASGDTITVSWDGNL